MADPHADAPSGDPRPGLDPIADAVARISEGGMVILVDDEDRENEGDLVVAAEVVTAEQVDFMARYGRGLICLALDGPRVDALGLEPMARTNTAPLGTAFTKSIDLRVGGGVGAAGRAATMRAAVDPARAARDFVTPGPVMPLRARPGGVLVRSGQTEGSVDLARLAGLAPAGVICEVMREDGTMARLPDLKAFAAEHGMPVVSVADLITYRLEHERLVREVAASALPTAHGTFRLHAFEHVATGELHVALSLGDLAAEGTPPLVRVHRGETLSDVLGMPFVKARGRLDWAMAQIAAEGRGALVYLRPEGDAEPLDDHVRRYGAVARGERGATTSGVMGFHEYGVGAQILGALGLTYIRVITSRPQPFKGLSGFGLEIVDWMPFPEELGGSR